MEEKTTLLIYNPRAGKSLGRPKPKEILDREYQRLEGEEPEGMSCFDRLIWLNYEVHSFMERTMDSLSGGERTKVMLSRIQEIGLALLTMNTIRISHLRSTSFLGLNVLRAPISK